MPHVYMLRCADGSLYVGSTRNLDARMSQHSAGRGSVYTSRRMPVELVWAAEYDEVRDAYAMEKKIQGWSRTKREALIRGDWDDVHRNTGSGSNIRRKRKHPD
ncbi:MAG: GIY-YIG nuclease family protein [Microbacteriaceae bacterium]|nr:GIY-YIG nuclease family protein [Microbacteriaceae bacterium]